MGGTKIKADTAACKHSESQHRALDKLEAHLVEKGLKRSRQRDVIVAAFIEANGHVSVEALLAAARKQDGKISQATVYRTIKLLLEAQIATARHFHDGHAVYELNDNIRGTHHDHMVCTQCHRIVEFIDPQIEARQHAVAKAHGFVLTDHRMELYGVCRDCHAA